MNDAVAMLHSPLRFLLAALLGGALVLPLSACESPGDATTAGDATRAMSIPEPATYADTVALRAFSYTGGPAAWMHLPYLGFDFAVENEGDRQLVARHLWNRQSGAYRLETPVSDDSLFVTLFDVDTREGTVYLNGTPVDSAMQAQRLEDAYRRFINDTYWLLAPTKLFDPGVRRTYVPDSSDADTDVIHLAFGDVGLTPGDQYWMYVDSDTGQLQRWTFLLQGREQPASATWTDYETLDTPAGPIRLATRHAIEGSSTAILTDSLSAPATIPDRAFTTPSWKRAQ